MGERYLLIDEFPKNTIDVDMEDIFYLEDSDIVHA